jgi:hypothetical protein
MYVPPTFVIIQATPHSSFNSYTAVCEIFTVTISSRAHAILACMHACMLLPALRPTDLCFPSETSKTDFSLVTRPAESPGVQRVVQSDAKQVRRWAGRGWVLSTDSFPQRACDGHACSYVRTRVLASMMMAALARFIPCSRRTV